MFVLQSSSTCWAMAVNDYGTIVSTLLALSTFAALFLLAYVLHRTLSSRTPEGRRRQQNAVADKHRRKKRKQHAHHRGSKSSAGGRHALGRSIDPIPTSMESDDILVVPNDNTKNDDDKVLDEMHVHDVPSESATTTPGLPPLAVVPSSRFGRQGNAVGSQ
jgi:hypothetical protein